MPEDHFKNVLKFWRAFETFHLPDIPIKRRNDHKLYAYLEPGKRLPWDPEDASAVRTGRQWRHTLYFGIVAKEAVVDLLARLTRSGEFRDPVPGRTCLSALVLDHWGRPTERSYFPTAFMYAIKLIQEKKNPEELEDALIKAQEEYLYRFQMDKGGVGERTDLNVVSRIMLEKELDHLLGLVGRELKVAPTVLCVSEQVAEGASMEAPFLNSYYLNDLNMLVNAGDIGGLLKGYLSKDVDLHSRQDLLIPQAMLQHLHPGNQPAGRWPAHPGSGLYSAQQAALHLVMPGLRDGSSLMGINGPPGTGKTTLLREVIADVVVTRAKQLLNANVTELFAGKRHTIADMSGYYDHDHSVFGDGIVVASNNNTAVENISKELPALESIDRITFPEAEYFSSTATQIHGKPCWGMLSAVLGKSDNRSDFVNKFWFNKGQGFGRYLKEQYEDPVLRNKNAANYEETAGELRGLLSEYENFLDLACAYHELLLEENDGVLLEGGDEVLPEGDDGARLRELGERLQTEYGIERRHLPSPGFKDLPMAEIHRSTPYSSEKINTLRSRIFLLSLELHEWAIKVNARQINSNLNSFVDLLSNKHANFIDEKIATILWNTFFFCIPVVSVTLASFQRQFSKLGRGRIGWLLLDEAGQATPASTCGAIWRSEKCIIIGDTQQISPIVTIPEALGKLLQNNYGIEADCWNPIYHSAQFLADRVTKAGTYIDAGNGEKTWTGIPLRAHRRCGEPMFSISNTIAYDGQMVKVTPDTIRPVPTGESGWIDVRVGSVMEGHVIVEELQVLEDLLAQLTYYDGSIFIISPFRTIADVCKEKFYVRDKIECGTIHTFQGKEAHILMLILGTHAGSVMAREWVAQRPNMLNVAVTRARERLYVIGNRKAWSAHRYFDHLAEKLPVKDMFTGRLF